MLRFACARIGKRRNTEQVEAKLTSQHRSQLPSLTGIRGVAALWVLLFHVQSFSPVFGAAYWRDLPIIGLGWAGVDLFFVLSGFILMHVHGTDFVAPGLLRTLRFFILRVFRVYPLATIVLLLIALVVALTPGFAEWYRQGHDPADFTLGAFWRTLTLSTRWFPPFTGDWNQPVWSLSAELVGYAAFPVLAFIAMRLRQWYLLLPLAVAALQAPVWLQPVFKSTLANDIFGYALIRMAGCFTGGIILYRLHAITPERWRRAQGAVADLGLVALIILLLGPTKASYANAGFGAIIYGIASNRGVTAWLTGNRVSLFLGAISFPLYLIHVTGLFAALYLLGINQAPAEVRHMALWALLGGLVVLAYALHLAVERPSHWAGRLLARRLVSPGEREAPVHPAISR